MQTVIETDGLTKRYGDVLAVDGVSLRVARGEIYAFLGLNGAGKTTTIRMLLGMVRPTSGVARVLGQPIHPGSAKPWDRVGYLVETPHAYPELTVRENLEVLRRLRPGTPPAAVEDIIARLALGPYANRRTGTLSLGNAQRLGLAKALLHTPDLLLLDEPANGLDPAGIVEIRHLLTTLAREQGVTVFLSSHILGEVARLAHRIGIIHQGRLIQELDVAALEHNRRRRLVVRTRDNVAASAALMAAGLSVKIMPNGDGGPTSNPSAGADGSANGSIEMTDPAAIERPDDIATRLVQAGHPPTLLRVEQEDLESYFLRLVGQRLVTQPEEAIP